MRPRWGKANEGELMSNEDRLYGEQPHRIEIFYEVPPSPQGTHQYNREDGTVVHGDASGEWALDENGDFEDVVFFASPRFLGYGRKVETRKGPA
jgi:hypothetical protein